jgi:ABC-2 type transport system ATP-binding protein
LVLQVTGLTKRYGRLTALSDVSFVIRPSEVLGLIGPNGSGKTTLFECLGGVLPADGGRVLALRPGSEQGDGRVLAAHERSATMFYLPDGIAPWPTQTVRWALDFTVGFFGAGSKVAQAFRPADATIAGLKPCATPEDVVKQLDLEPLLDSPIGTLSKGQRKRALLAIGLLTPQPVLLADEPFDGLDLRQSRDVARTLRAHAATGRTLVLSIHQITDAARVCDRFVLLSGGRVRGEGTFDELSEVAAAHGAPAADLEEVFLALT